MTVGELTVVIAYLGAVYGPLVVDCPHDRTAARRDRRRQARARDARAGCPKPSMRRMPSMPTRISGEIRFEDVGFYVSGRHRGPARHHASTAKPGEMIALVGLTGAGKTTLVSLIPRFYDATAGRVLVDGVDVRRYRVRSLREKIAIVLQDPVLFSGTIADNLRYGRLDATDGRDRSGRPRRARARVHLAAAEGVRHGGRRGRAAGSRAASASG